jgi:hypothetical protein
MGQSEKLLIWLDDNFDGEGLDEIAMFIERDYELHCANDLYELHGELFETREACKPIKGIMLDMMVHGIDSLDIFGMPDIKWSIGSNVGEMVLKHILRNPTNTDWSYFNETPVLILSVKSHILSEDYSKYGINIEVIQKLNSDSNDDQAWIEEVKQWVRNLK